MTGHTPTPWKVGDIGTYWTNSVDIDAGSHGVVATTTRGFEDGPSMANAAFIVRAVNSFDAMRGALETACALLEEFRDYHDSPNKTCGSYDAECCIGMGEWCDTDWRQEFESVRAALALSQAESST